MATRSVKVVKEFLYRGETRRFSNRYHIDGDNFADQAAFEDWADLIVAAEREIFTPDIHIVQVAAYDAGNDAVKWSKNYSTAGTYDAGETAVFPGDSAALLRVATEERSSKNHPVYCFSYYHGARQNVSGDPDALQEAYANAVKDYGDAWLDGFELAGVQRPRTTPDGGTTTSCFVQPFVTHRDLPRRS